MKKDFTIVRRHKFNRNNRKKVQWAKAAGYLAAQIPMVAIIARKVTV